MRPSLRRPEWQNFKETRQSGSVNYSWRAISCNEVGETTQACFSSFPHASPYPLLFPHPPSSQRPNPPLHSPRPPRILVGSTNESSTAAFLPRDKNLQVWCNPSLCLSCCLTPITCSVLNDSASQSYRIGKAHNMWVFMVTTLGHDNCLPGEAMHTKKNTHLLCLFIILPCWNMKTHIWILFRVKAKTVVVNTVLHLQLSPVEVSWCIKMRQG